MTNGGPLGKRQEADEMLAALGEKEAFSDEARRIIRDLAREELTDLCRQTTRQIFREEVFPVLKRILDKFRKEARHAVPQGTDAGGVHEGGIVETPLVRQVGADPAPSTIPVKEAEKVPQEPPDYRPPIEPRVGTCYADPETGQNVCAPDFPGDKESRQCLCCGETFTPGEDRHARAARRFCPVCQDSNTRRSRSLLITAELWTSYPEIAEMVVEKLKESGRWAG